MRLRLAPFKFGLVMTFDDGSRQPEHFPKQLLSSRLLDDTDRDVRAAGGAEVEPALKLKGNKLETEMSSTA